MPHNFIGISILAFVIVIGIIIWFSIGISSLSNTYNFKIIKEEISPSKKAKAIYFEGNSGATSGFVYRISILNPYEKLSKNNKGNVLITDSQVKMKWKNDTLVLYYCAQEKDVFKMEDYIKGIKILHEFCK